jgi:hypothetical protein
MNIVKYLVLALSFVCLTTFAQINYNQLTTEEKAVSHTIFNTFKGLKDVTQSRFENYSSTHPEHYEYEEGFDQPLEQYLREGLLQQRLDEIDQIQIDDQNKARASQVVRNIFNHFIAALEIMRTMVGK